MIKFWVHMIKFAQYTIALSKRCSRLKFMGGVHAEELAEGTWVGTADALLLSCA